MEKFALSLVRQAGEILLKKFKKNEQLLTLRGQSKEVTTKYDKLVDRFVIEKISQRYPRHSFLTEESGKIHPKGKSSDHLWILDSLDGSANFSSGNPLFSICLALIKKRKIIFGITYAPALNELYFAKLGKGAFFNGNRIRVSKTKEFSRSYLYFCEGGERDRKRTGKILVKLYPQVTDIRKLGSAGLEIAWVAMGRAEAFLTTEIFPWDVASGIILIKEAGGRVTDFKGKAWEIDQKDLIFSNKKIHQDLVKLVEDL